MNTLKQDLIAKFQEVKKKEEEQVKTKLGEEKKKLSEREQFFKFIKEAQDYDPILNLICNQLKHFIGATGVYIAIKDQKRKKVTENDDETAHLDKDIEVIRYISWDDQHAELLKGRYLDLESGVTNFLFKPPEEDDKKPDDQVKQDDGTGQEEKEKKVEEEKINQVKVDEVVREKKIKFFKEPRLGCYRAIDITYKTSLSKHVST
jgi:hypothetical protein